MQQRYQPFTDNSKKSKKNDILQHFTLFHVIHYFNSTDSLF